MTRLTSLFLKCCALGGILVALLSCTTSTSGAEASPPSFEKHALPLIKRYCLKCHGESKRVKGGVNLTTFLKDGDLLKAPGQWRDVVKVLRNEEMPPSYRRQPSKAERQQLIRAIETVLARSLQGKGSAVGPPIVRRLTRLEYNCTVRDLLGLKVDVFSFPERLPYRRDYFHPERKRMPEVLKVTFLEYGNKVPVLLRQSGLPGDNKAEHGFTNRADALSISPVLMEKYLGLATEIVNAPSITDASPVLRDLLTEPGKEPGARGNASGIQVVLTEKLASNNNVTSTALESAFTLKQFRELLAKTGKEGTGGTFADPAKKGASVVRSRLNESLILKLGNKTARQLMVTPTRDLWLAGFATAEETSGAILFTNKNRNDKVFDLVFRLVSDQPTERLTQLGVCVLSRKKQTGDVTLTIHFSGGGSRSLTERIAEGAGKDNTFFSFSAPRGQWITRLQVDGSRFSGDFVLLDDLAVVVTPVKGSDLASKAQVKGTSQKQSPRDRFAHFVRRAFRGPVAREEVDRYWGIHSIARKMGKSHSESMKDAIRGVLSSPRFLYRVERAPTDAEKVRPLDDYELANRLSYFLWTSMPDDALLRLAEQRKLREPKVLDEQLQRMLKDPRIKELSETFAFQWLQLNELFGSQPDRKRYRKFYSGPKGKRTLTMDMITEVLLHFERIVIEDRSILELFDARQAYLNERLIQLYGYKERFKKQLAQLNDPRYRGDVNRGKIGRDAVWFRLDLPNRRRGGVLTSGAVLTLTSLPLRTSPVYRGAWVREVIFNDPPPPPPAQVDELGSDDREFQEKGLTIRKKLELHRKNPQCASCHSRIDPLGFALENYDGIGAWRDSYSKLPVDSSGTLPGGRRYHGPEQFKDALLQKKEELARAFIEHLLSYALNRKLEHYDSSTVQAIERAAAKTNYRFSTVLREMVNSPSFRQVKTRASN